VEDGWEIIHPLKLTPAQKCNKGRPPLDKISESRYYKSAP